jgi:hypothetical protein
VIASREIMLEWLERIQSDVADVKREQLSAGLTA